MHKPSIRQLKCLQTAISPVWNPWHYWQMFLVSLGLMAALGQGWQPARAQSPQAAPPEIKNVLAQIDAAANKKDVQAVLQYYSPNFTHSDGLTRQTLEQALTELWKRYPNLNYQTELNSWKADGNGILTETTTKITGTQKVGTIEWKLNSTLKSQQRFENQKIVKQEILAEKSLLTSGSNPPVVTLNLPEQVKVGQSFNFDAIVQEPLGNDLLLGAALEEPVKPEGLLKPTIANLELLNAGGIFKVGRVPLTGESRWLSAILVRHNGMTMVTQRLRVTGGKPPAAR
ncbi:nuclear transport factor 2 family protein [Leptothermofonsia sichuanensis]|uniref:nuclear transport factor 2 family protein n=1 Tax=Leptothermofonsia sichuanensis TaxID=2917832 RepID=UPI001CEDD553|nr:nuclear transport factor 2 family protein [Leptothermofonsia sichuanensis]